MRFLSCCGVGVFGGPPEAGDRVRVDFDLFLEPTGGPTVSTTHSLPPDARARMEMLASVQERTKAQQPDEFERVDTQEPQLNGSADSAMEAETRPALD
jgi:hypothetical protein